MKRGIALLIFITISLTFLLPFASFAANGTDTIRVGWAPREHMTEVNNGVYSGYTYDYLAEIAKYTGWKYEYVVGDVETLLSMLEHGEIDILGSMLYTDERAERIEYSALPYGNKYAILFTSDRSPLHERDYESYNGMTVGALASDTASIERFAEFAREVGFEYKLITYSTTAMLNDAISSSKVDSGIVDAFTSTAGVHRLAEFSPIPYYFATTVGNTKVQNALNRALFNIANERPYIERELYDLHFGIPFDTSLTASEKSVVNMSKANPITVGVIPSNAPVCYYDEDKGEYIGIVIEILKAIEHNTGINFEFVPIDLSKGAPVIQMRQGDLDIVAGILKSKAFEDDPTLSLSASLLSDAIVVIGHKGNDFTQDAENKVIATITGFQVAQEYITEKFPQNKTAKYKTFTECFDALAAGDVDAVVYVRSCASFLLQDPHYDELEAIQSYYQDIDICAAGLSADNRDIVGILNKGLAMLDENAKNGIIMNTTVMNPYHMTVSDMLYKYKIPIAVIAFLFIAVIVIFIVLIEVRKQSMKKLKEALELAKNASSAKGNFMSRMSHEIRTPLNAIIGYNTIASKDMHSAKTEAERRQTEMRVMDCLTKSEIASKHLLTIINDVLDMSAIESGKVIIINENFDFKNLISSLNAIFYSQAKTKGVSLETTIATPTDEWYIGDKTRINQMLTNLLSNAVKFTPKGGTVKFTIKQTETKKGFVRLCFEVADTGIGMTQDYLNHIWTPFEQADSSISRRFGGTGLGLSITKNLVKLMGGTIDVTSEQGKGSTFTVELVLERTMQPNSYDAYDFGGMNALIVDDDKTICGYIKFLFQRSGVRCTTVTSGADAINAFEKARHDKDPFTVCFVDWNMPEMNGEETIGHLREISDTSLPIVVISACDLSEITDHAAEFGVDKFISKPLFQSSIFDVLVELSGGSKSNPENSSSYDFDGARVLLVEDNEMNMEIAKRILESANITVDSAWNGKEAVEAYTNSEPDYYKAILMDIQMPVMDGYQATAVIRGTRRDDAAKIPIIAMTADAFAENVAEMLKMGMDAHIAKPIDVPTLFSTLHKYIVDGK